MNRHLDSPILKQPKSLKGHRYLMRKATASGLSVGSATGRAENSGSWCLGDPPEGGSVGWLSRLLKYWEHRFIFPRILNFQEKFEMMNFLGKAGKWHIFKTPNKSSVGGPNTGLWGKSRS